MIVSFVIPGVPQQAGSKVKNRYGAIYDENAKLGPWRRDALACARDARPTADEGPVFAGPVAVSVVAYFKRPGSHFGSGRNAGVLKPGAPAWCTTTPDLDKTLRALGDVLTEAQIVLDDRLIVAWDAVKVYGDPRMSVTVADVFEEIPLILDDVDEQEALL